MHKNMIILVLLVVLLYSGRSEAYDSLSPWDFNSPERSGVSAEQKSSFFASLIKEGVIFFSNYISPVDGDRCPMHPTCAAYSREALEKHGFLKGILLTADRLLHEGDEMKTAPLIKVGDRMRYLDPVSNNDFWWHRESLP